MRQDRIRSLDSATGCSQRFSRDKEKLESAIWDQARIHCEVTFDAGTAIITPLGADAGDYAAFVVARSIARTLGFQAKQGTA